MKKFAKLFESEKYGQIVVMLREPDSDSSPGVEMQVRIYFYVGDMAEAEMGIGFPSVEAAEQAFDVFDQQLAESKIGPLIDSMASFNPDA